jgi:hypothetical protein
MNPFKSWLIGFRDRLFGDPAGLVELLSSLALIGWAIFFWRHPTTIYRDSYAAFQIAPLGFWITLFAGVGTSQVLASLFDHSRRHDLRWVAMALACGIWVTIAGAFSIGDVPTTAPLMYFLIAMVTALATVWLAWTSSQNT